VPTIPNVHLQKDAVVVAGNWKRHAYSTERTRIVVPKGPPPAT
jgi:hypothetical protein